LTGWHPPKASSPLYVGTAQSSCTAIGAALYLCRLEGVARSLIFDGNEYTERCLRPVRVGSVLPSLVDRYALDQRHLDMPDHELFGWIEQVVDLWRRQAGHGVVTIANVCAQLLAADEDLRGTPDYREAEWWRDLIRGARPAAADLPASPGATNPAAEPHSSAGAPPHPGTEPSLPRSAQGAPIIARPAPPKKQADVTKPTLPPPAVLDVTAAPRDDHVVVRWQVPPDASSSVKFLVERLAGPGVEGRRWRASGTVVEDRDPPAGLPLVYEVVTQKPSDGTKSDAMRADVVFAPPVTGLVARQVSNGGVTGRWQTRGNVQETQVWRIPAGSSADPTDGASIPSQPDRFHDRGVPPGHHVYSVVPIYRDPETGRTYRGEYSSVHVEVFDRPPLPRVEVAEDHHGAADILLRWDQLPPGVSLLMRRAAAEPAGGAGDALTLEEARRIGDPVADGEALSDTTARVTVQAGQWVLIPFSVAGDLAVRGRSITVVVVPPVKNPEATRKGVSVEVSWEWPEGMLLARVVWRTGDAELEREVTINEFRRLGRVVFAGSEAGEAQICGIVRSGTDELMSAPVMVSVPAQTPTLTFHVRRIGPWQMGLTRPYRLHGPGWWRARRQIVITADLPCAGLRLEFYVRSRTVGADSEVPVCAIDDVELGPGSPHEVTVTLPDLSALDRPRYMACRAETMSGPVRVNEFASTGREIRP
jgi:hypothetical protein